ncbi:sensor domain-containing diguanylate cyclase [Pseudomonas gingeri]|uniref:sensor domain-containing diguanylate cyclase n=1 Tax=Pseudomonas gingeri TaxID=117681 RepID=UPI0015A0B153|nr:sensor domain-containing diguanylate cyclase [Pseudomonas gingeri]NWA11579.1 GGDEF domain-containing protein [Pseudomonas gingeri]
MPTRPAPKLTLRILILLFTLTAAVATLINSIWVTYKVQKQELIDSALEIDHAFAVRVATGVDQVLSADLSKLAYGAHFIAAGFDDQQRINEQIGQLLAQDPSFSSVIVANAAGVVIASAPANLGVKGQPLRDKTPLEQRTPLISNSFKSIAGNLVVFISHPIIGAKGEYLGLIGGAVRLDQQNELRDLIAPNIRHDGAFVYLVDKARRVLYHPQDPNIGSIVGQDPIVDAALKRDSSGSLQASDANGIEMLAGFANVPSSGWGVVSQQPLQRTQDRLDRLMLKVGFGIAPMALIGLALIWWSGIYISRPLSRLATYAKNLDAAENVELIKAVPARFVEVWRIRHALLLSASLLQEKIVRLNKQAHSDLLTGLANRRAMQDTLDVWKDAEKSFALIYLDIDHFKRVNDTYGHALGDQTLQALAELLRANSRANDLPCRIGGEEFCLLLPGTSLAMAAEVAERLRSSIENTKIETVGHITVSSGVALWTPGRQTISSVFETADKLLYEAKQSGRNRVKVEQVADLA